MFVNDVQNQEKAKKRKTLFQEVKFLKYIFVLTHELLAGKS